VTRFWSTDRANPYFALQHHRGHEETYTGITSLIVATIDSVLNSKTNCDRVFHRRSDSKVYHSDTKEEVEEHLMPTFDGINASVDVIDYV
ncbi:unnamed protein product, partial [Rotaria sordida]